MSMLDAALEFVETRRRGTIITATVLAVAIAVVDWVVEPNLSLGFLYIFPVMLAGAHFSHGQIAVFALVASIFREVFSPFRLQPAYQQRTAVVWLVFTAAGILIAEILRNRRLTVQHFAFREQAARQLRAIVETSPIAIVTFDKSGRILLANSSAHRLLVFEQSSDAQPIVWYFEELTPWLDKAQENWSADFECRGRKQDGDMFFAHLWASAYKADSGIEVAAVIWDASDQLRGRETATLDSVATASRVLLGAVSHEVRNLTSAAATLHNGLTARYNLRRDKDSQTLGSVLDALASLAASGLQEVTSRNLHAVDLASVLDEFRIVIAPLLEEASVRLVWEVADDMPHAAGDRSGLLQVLLNLANNSVRALRDAESEFFRSGVQVRRMAYGCRSAIRDLACGIRRRCSDRSHRAGSAPVSASTSHERSSDHSAEICALSPKIMVRVSCSNSGRLRRSHRRRQARRIILSRHEL
jgi:two-component system, LuxR family, sensor kinase FixL